MKQGRVVINYNICDNAPECSGIEACPTGAMHWDEEKQRIDFIADTCIDCGACADACPVGAILWGENDADYERKKIEVDNETRRQEDLVVERYGAAPIEAVLGSDVKEYIKNAKKDYIFLEFFNDDSIQCLLHSIPVEEIKSALGINFAYKKIQLTKMEDCDICKITELPALVVVKNTKVSSAVCGYFDDGQKDEFIQKLKVLI